MIRKKKYSKESRKRKIKFRDKVLTRHKKLIAISLYKDETVVT